MTPEQMRARQGQTGGAPVAAGPTKISPEMRDLLAAQAAEREAMEIDHHNEKIELREQHVAAVQALAAKVKAQAEANETLAAAAAEAKKKGK